MMKNRATLDTDQLRSRLKLKTFSSERALLSAHSSAAKFFETYKLRPGQIRQHAAKLISSGALAGSLLLSSGIPVLSTPAPQQNRIITVAGGQELAQNLTGRLWPVLPEKVGPLTPEQENKISDIIGDVYGIKAVASLEGNHLNQTYGRMGAEQHLPRYPGDNINNHNIPEKGMTPGLGAWGYVTDSEVEKYYVAVQTLYLPEWNDPKKLPYLIDWYKYRRVVVVNPDNGKAVVAAVADSGPAWWTGKAFGGSPEVMAYLGINIGMQNSPVVLFFLDDKDKKVPLGPLEYNSKEAEQLAVDKT